MSGCAGSVLLFARISPVLCAARNPPEHQHTVHMCPRAHTQTQTRTHTHKHTHTLTHTAFSKAAATHDCMKRYGIVKNKTPGPTLVETSHGAHTHSGLHDVGGGRGDARVTMQREQSAIQTHLIGPHSCETFLPTLYCGGKSHASTQGCMCVVWVLAWECVSLCVCL